jgi:hypothetical protein
MGSDERQPGTGWAGQRTVSVSAGGHGIARFTLSRWRHGFEPRWDYAGQGPYPGVARASGPEYQPGRSRPRLSICPRPTSAHRGRPSEKGSGSHARTACCTNSSRHRATFWRRSTRVRVTATGPPAASSSTDRSCGWLSMLGHVVPRVRAPVFARFGSRLGHVKERIELPGASRPAEVSPVRVLNCAVEGACDRRDDLTAGGTTPAGIVRAAAMTSGEP